jgi:hypothetical protein
MKDTMKWEHNAITVSLRMDDKEQFLLEITTNDDEDYNFAIITKEEVKALAAMFATFAED